MLPIINKKCFLFGADAADKADLIKQMVGTFAKEGYLSDRELFHQSILAREKEFPTYIDCNIAIPHGKTDAVREAGLCVARLAKKIVWDEESGDEVDFVVMIAVRASDGSDLHLHILAQLSRMLMHEEFRDKVKQGSEDEVYDLMQQTVEVQQA